jgi:zinc transport system substrate-binding protein
MRGIIKILMLFAVCLLFPAFFAVASEINVFVSIAPQKYFVEKIGGDRVDVQIMVPAGSSPHTYEPAPRQMAQLAGADAYFSIGVTFEKAWMEKIRSANRSMLLIDTARDIQKKPASGHTHGHGHDHNGHAHGILDPHIWLSPSLVKIQARNILAGLVKIDPPGREAYESNYASFIAEIADLDLQLKEHLTPGMEFMVYHPSWGYFADDYGLTQIPIEIDGKAPKAKQIQEVIQYAQTRGIQVVFVQPQISTRDAEMIARSIGGQTVRADPLAENWAQNLKDVAELIGKQQNQ